MDQFCDDLIEDILCFMNFEDKIKYECVCHQWKRCLFKKQTSFVIDGNEELCGSDSRHSLNQLVVKTKVDNALNRINVMRKTSFESVLKKCPHIRKLVISGCECDNELLQMIGDNCPHLEDLECELVRINPYENCILELGSKLGKNLKRFRFVYFAIAFEIVKGFLYCCPKLESVNCDILAAISDQRLDFLPNLNNLRVRVRPSDAEHFEIIAEKYSMLNSLRSLTIYGNSECFPEALTHISNIISLQSLTIDVNSDTSADSLVAGLKLIAKKVENLKLLKINSMVFISGQLFQCLGHFKSLTKLSVTQNLLFTRSNSNINISQLNGCKQLRHLSIMGFNISQQFFADIALYLPHLKSIELSLMLDNVINEHLFHTFQELQQLVKLSLKITNNKAKRLDKTTFDSLVDQLIATTDNGLSLLINCCPKLRIICATNIFTEFVGQNTLNAIITKATNNKKLNYVLRIIDDQFLNRGNCRENIDHDHLPHNLSIRWISMNQKSTTSASDYLADFD